VVCGLTGAELDELGLTGEAAAAVLTLEAWTRPAHAAALPAPGVDRFPTPLSGEHGSAVWGHAVRD
jgi:hypothetical protein